MSDIDPSTVETPASLGYRMPAEWEPRQATWIAWPHNEEDWPGKFEPIPWVYAEIVRHLAAVEQVNIVVKGTRMRVAALNVLSAQGVNLENVEFIKASTDRVWLRDSGPTFVIDDQAANAADRVALVNWRFNAWAKYHNYHDDKKLPKIIANHLGIRRFAPRVGIGEDSKRVVMEGGAIEVNGKGCLLTTEECLLSDIQSRNPGLDRAGVEKVFAENLGVTKVIWLGKGIFGDDTHGHIDDLARFVNPSTIVTVVESDESDPNFEPLQENKTRLAEATDQDGRPFRVVELPMPSPVIFEGQRLPASYANFYIGKGIVLVPTFNDPKDREALNTLAEVFPDHQIIGIHSVDLVLGLGTLHCLTQQQPA